MKIRTRIDIKSVREVAGNQSDLAFDRNQKAAALLYLGERFPANVLHAYIHDRLTVR